jgi:putative methyltransferase (TIGR04325 family)
MLRAVLKSIPVVSDALDEHVFFSRRVTAVRGLYATRAEAEAAIAQRGEALGFDHFDTDESALIAKITAAKRLDAMEPREYPVLYWLRALLRPSERVFNIGGNIGLDYYAYSQVWPELKRHPWTVCETPKIARAGAALAVERGAIDLTFTADVQTGEGADALVCVGTLQYLPYDLAATIDAWRRKPRVVILAIFPAVADGGDFWTVQNIGYASAPYRIVDLSALNADFARIGYEPVATWAFPREVSIPFHRDKKVDAYHGCVFVRPDAPTRP